MAGSVLTEHFVFTTRSNPEDSTLDTPLASLDAIIDLIDGIDAPGSYATTFKLPADRLTIDVDGVGPLPLPVDARTVRALKSIAQPAPYGQGERTLLDPAVRDTGRIAPEFVRIEPDAWEPMLQQALQRIRRDLGLDPRCRIEARFHDLLVYDKGQFFRPHQDSEKVDGMFGTMVVALPSRFTGGEFLISHHDDTLRVGGSQNDLVFIALYADCRHEILPVTSGHRVVLTWNLIVINTPTSSGHATPDEALVHEIGAYFTSPRPPRWSWERNTGSPEHLVLLLDHEYTQRGLAWDRLKNVDAVRAARLQAAAQAGDCEIFLALADVHETWSCDDGWGSRVTLTELVDSEVELRHLVAPDGEVDGATMRIDVRDVGWTKPNRDCKPFASEHEGFTGNAGNTVDHWYHRAAIVMWPRERGFALRARGSIRWAVDELLTCLDDGEVDEVTRRARELLPFWNDVVRQRGVADPLSLLTDVVHVAANLGEGALSTALLSPFRLSDLSPGAARPLVDLSARHGFEHVRSVMRAWFDQERVGNAVGQGAEWMTMTLPVLCRTLCDEGAAPGDGLRMAEVLLQDRWAWLNEQVTHAGAMDDPDSGIEALSGLGRPVVALLESCLIADQSGLRETVLSRLHACLDPVDIHLPLTVLWEWRAQDGVLPADLQTLRHRVERALGELLARPPRALDDWSMTVPIRCNCDLCDVLRSFLAAADKAQLEWPLAKAGRQHVHIVIDSHGLPVRHETRRSGSPYTLVLTKTGALFERDATTRRAWAGELAWLRATPDTTSR